MKAGSLKRTLRDSGIFPYKGRGQHFLVQGAIAGRIVDTAMVGGNDTIVEIGPGTGVLTQLLVSRAKRLIAIESDRKLAELVSERFTEEIGRGEMEVVLYDALKYDFAALGERIGGKLVVVANLPYNISTEMIFRLLEAGARIDRFVLMLQREVAERLTAVPGTKKYGALTVMATLQCDITQEFKVGRGNFHPVPKVDSAVVLFKVRENQLCDAGDLKIFKAIVRAAFNNRRKTLRNALKSVPDIVSPGDLDALGEAAGINLGRRGETLSVEEFGALSRAVRELAFRSK
ncbi:MAG: ribosomal RNA small subunit methyltransferase A [Deltaproteobacteria bacterium]|uniref:Ribosomal RNA small subunit methyltransferase A n=1 Tax=Candidatus Zymogenus saltonus TaxID=2844893 RepID=A0A9D8KDE4_9DELT|nr:ribosomal RNA small subunit methyltransferase A [Candidatus Zymogenus saltonus]